VIRRVFWFTVGAAAGVSGYRKVAKAARVFSPARPSVRSGVPPPDQQPAGRLAGLLARGARSAAGFVSDVNDGRRIYRLAGAREAARLGRQIDAPGWAFNRAVTDAETDSFDQVKDGQ